MHDHVQITLECLLGLLRFAHEIPSAEYILVDDGSLEVRPILFLCGYFPPYSISSLYPFFVVARAFTARNTQCAPFESR